MFKKNVNNPEVEETWVWAEGYKATDKNMCCKGYQYEIGKQFDMPEDEKIEMCESGFHMCKDLKDVFRYYSIGQCNRFWKVRALVRKADLDRYNSDKASSPFGYLTFTSGGMVTSAYIDKLVAKSIEFMEELTIDEILEASGIDMTDWTESEKIIAIETGLDAACENINVRKLEALGYNRDMAKFIIGEGKFKKAYALGKQPDISMETRIKCIF